MRPKAVTVANSRLYPVVSLLEDRLLRRASIFSAPEECRNGCTHSVDSKTTNLKALETAFALIWGGRMRGMELEGAIVNQPAPVELFLTRIYLR